MSLVCLEVQQEGQWSKAVGDEIRDAHRSQMIQNTSSICIYLIFRMVMESHCRILRREVA